MEGASSLGRPRRLRRTLSLGGALLLALVFLQAASPAAAKKQYSASVSPAAATVNFAQSYTFTLTNLSSSVRMGAATIQVPSGFTINSVGPVSASGGKPWSASLVAGVIRLGVPNPSAANRLAPSESVNVTVNATAPCAAGTYSWPTTAQESNGGGSGSSLTRVGPDPATTVAGVCAPASVTACPAAGCEGSSSNGDTSVHVTVPGGGNAGTLTIVLSTPPADDGCGQSSVIGSLITVDPPGGYTPGNPIDVKITYLGFTGGPVTICKNNGPGGSFQVLPNCNFPEVGPPIVGPPCVRTQGFVGESSDYQVEVLMTSTDPAFTGH